jgi:sugar phosphate isomerase/epimerase
MRDIMILGYNTNGLIDVDAIQAIELVHSIGYRGIALSLDSELLNPFAADFTVELQRTGDRLRQLGIRSVIETGARYLLNPDVKHEPTLLTADPVERARRVDFLRRAIDVATALGSEGVSLWSGRAHGTTPGRRDGEGDREAMDRLVGGLAEVLEYAARNNVPLAFEPEPGMFIDTMDRFGDLLEALEDRRIDADRLRLTIDVGHLHCQGELPIAEKLRQWAGRLANVHIEDMRSGVHEHLMFGEGEIDFPPVIAALAEIGYSGIIGVELSRHAHVGPEAALQAYNFMRPLLDAASAGGRGSRRA